MEGYFVIGTLPSSEEGEAIPSKWALFDLDWTLIRPVKGKMNKIFNQPPISNARRDKTSSESKGGRNWRWLPGRLDRLKNFVRDGYTLGIVTNKKPYPQYPLTVAMEDATEIHQQLKDELGVDVPIMAGTTSEHYRKPSIGWFDHIIALPDSLMVGDAAGRPCDFSDSDRVFAEQAGLYFFTPEEVFPFALPNLALPKDILTTRPYLIIMMGAPGSGKSTLASSLQEKGWTWISSDSYKSNFNRIYKAVQSALQKGEAVVVDATNPSRERREQYRQLASSLNSPSAIVHMVDSGEDRNKCRVEGRVPPVAYGQYWKRYEEPVEEGLVFEFT